MRRNQLLLKNLKATTYLTQTRQYFHINSFNYSFTRKVISFKINISISNFIHFVKSKSGYSRCNTHEYPSSLAIHIKNITDSKPPKLEILPPTLTGQQKGSHVSWRLWKYGKIELSPISVSRLGNVLKIAVL